MKAVCIIPARGGSVRIPRKNIAPFHGKPMLLHAIEAAQAARLFDTIVVSTDDHQIDALAFQAVAAVFRRNGHDDGSRGTQEIATEVLRKQRFWETTIACVLYPCTPLLTWQDMTMGYRRLLSLGAHVYTHSVHKDGSDAGGYYFGWTQAFLDGVPLQGNSLGVSVKEHFDINTPEDWARAETRWAELHKVTA
jgi:GTP:adenosylcobinamide-phosphate guanylyltransferase